MQERPRSSVLRIDGCFIQAVPGSRGQRTEKNIQLQLSAIYVPDTNTGCLFHRHFSGQTHHTALQRAAQTNSPDTRVRQSHVWQTCRHDSVEVNSGVFDPGYQSHTRAPRMRSRKQKHYALNVSVQEEPICMSSGCCQMSLLQRRRISRYRLHVSIMYAHLMSFSGCSELMDSCRILCVCACACVAIYVNIVVLEGGGRIGLCVKM